MRPVKQIKDETPEGMIGVMNNDPRLINLPEVGGTRYNLVPGMNYLPVDYSDRIRTRSDIQDMEDPGTSHDGRSAMVVFGATGRKLIPDNVRETLANLSEVDAISMIKDATEDGLTRWAAQEKRGTVKMAINARLKEIAAGK